MKAIWSTTSVLAGAAVVAMAVYHLALQQGLQRLALTADHRLDVMSAGLDAQMKRFEYLPSLLEMNASVFRLLDGKGEMMLVNEVNRYLHEVNATAGSTTLYVMNRAGRCLAASDWSEPGTPYGADLSFRPYVKDALARGKGRFYGVGVTSGVAGYYMAYALRHKEQVLGVATVKISVEESERTWSKMPGDVVVLDERGVVILSSRSAWKYRPLLPLGPGLLDAIRRERPYGQADLVPLNWSVRQKISDQAERVRVEGIDYLMAKREQVDSKWQLVALEDIRPAQAEARGLAATVALGASVLLLLGVLVWHRLSNQAVLKAANDDLESRVKRRTHALQIANHRLAAEVEARKAIDAHLRETQHELIHAGKMAVLGQMSAGIVHEINQPLAALRTLSDNACVLIDKNRLDDVRGNLRRIALLVDRLGTVTYQLKAFAHKAEQSRVPVCVRQVIANMQFLLTHRLRSEGVEMLVNVEPEGLTALADDIRLEQVLVNLVGNALDAVADRPTRQIRIDASAGNGRCVISVQDTGPGIDDSVLPRLFEPFTTTKPVGSGLGLGLMISAHIVREFGGSLSGRNAKDGGARFVIDLLQGTTSSAGREHG